MLFVRKGDLVVVLAGKDKGKQGRVLKVFPEPQKIIVEKINFGKRHTKPNREQQQGGIVEKEIPIPVSKVQIICGKCRKNTRVAYKILGDKKTRVCKNCGEILGK